MIATILDYFVTFLEVHGVLCAVGLIGIFLIGLFISFAFDNKIDKKEKGMSK